MKAQRTIRERLEGDLRAMLPRHARISGHLRNEDREIPLGWPEMTQFMENNEVLEALEARTRERMEDLSRALRRLDEGAYRTCGSCGKQVSTERLDVLPTTPMCADCGWRSERSWAITLLTN